MCVSEFLIQILQLMTNRCGGCVCVCACGSWEELPLPYAWEGGGGDKAHRSVLEEGYLEPPCPAMTPHLVQWAEGSKHP